MQHLQIKQTPPFPTASLPITHTERLILLCSIFYYICVIIEYCRHVLLSMVPGFSKLHVNHHLKIHIFLQSDVLYFHPPWIDHIHFTPQTHDYGCFYDALKRVNESNCYLPPSVSLAIRQSAVEMLSYNLAERDSTLGKKDFWNNNGNWLGLNYNFLSNFS